ncbi:MAG: RNA polymerase sigma factor [Bacteroidota bacterium]
MFKVIDTLPERQKTAFTLSFVEELPRQEVADIMDISLRAVESMLQRGKGILRNKLENLYPIEGNANNCCQTIGCLIKTAKRGG